MRRAGWVLVVVALMAPPCTSLSPPSMSPLAGPMPRLERMANYIQTGPREARATQARAAEQATPTPSADMPPAASLVRPRPFSMSLQGVAIADLPKKCEWAPGEAEPACEGVRMYDLILHASSRCVASSHGRDPHGQWATRAMAIS